MHLHDYIKLWDDYYLESIQCENYIPTNPVLKKYYDSYTANSENIKKQVDYIAEPFLGDANKAKIVIINTNPGDILPCQNWKNGEFALEMKEIINNGSQTPYSDWAKKFTYFGMGKKSGEDFWNQRLTYINSVIDTPITKEDLFAFEIYPWHSKTFSLKHLQNKSTLFKQFILDPIMDMNNVKYVFILRTPANKAVEHTDLKFENISKDWVSKDLKVKLAKHNGKIFIGTINNHRGYPSNDNDVKILKELIQTYS